jgi:thioredoxin 1
MKESEKHNGHGYDCGCNAGSCRSGRGKWIWIIVTLAVAGVLIAKNDGKKPVTAGKAPVAMAAPVTNAVILEAAPVLKALPRLVDLGAGRCVPCKMMAPILEDLKKSYAGKMDVEFIDVWENPEAGKKVGINVIPTQIFYDAQGKELFRHEGFFGKEDILAKWKELGVELAQNPEARSQNPE